MVQAINVAAGLDSDSDDPMGLTSSYTKSRRDMEAGKKISKKQFAKNMRRPASATYDNEAFYLIDGIRTERRIVKYEGTEEDKKQE